MKKGDIPLCLVLVLTLGGCGPRLSIKEAIKAVSADEVKKHIKAGLDLRQTVEHSASKQTPLHYAAERYAGGPAVTDGQQAILELLLDSAQDVDVRDLEQQTPLHIAAWTGGTSVAQILLDHRVDVDAVDRTGLTALHLAARKTDVALCRLLLERGANPNAQQKNGQTPMHEALLRGQNSVDLTKEIVELLLANGANINLLDAKGTPPSRCVEAGSEMARYLQSRGARR